MTQPLGRSSDEGRREPAPRKEDWATGDMLGLKIPAHAQALRQGGEAFLTEAFRAAGALSPDNRVARITQFEDCPGGSTGRKLLLAVEYERPADLPTDLFVKFSRDFDNPIRDRGRDQMQSEVEFALLSRTPGFPITVPKCCFADYEKASGTGVLITERVAFGEGAIERHYEKCQDYEMPEPLGHYRALVRAVARLAGAHKGGRLPPYVDEQFPFDPEAATAADPIRYDARQLQSRAARFGEFFAACPQLVPENIRDPAFIARLTEEAPRFQAHQGAIKRYLYSHPDFIALCHWNANIDNAWFWRNDQGEVECGLMDWGRVGQMNVALALWGGLSAAEKSLWDEHLDDLLALFVAEHRKAGGPAVDAAELRFQLDLVVAMLGLSWLMDGPALIRRQLPDIEQIESRFDPRLVADEIARTQLHMNTIFLNLWERHDFGAQLEELLRRTGQA
jgi:hypothetical protein